MTMTTYVKTLYVIMSYVMMSCHNVISYDTISHDVICNDVVCHDVICHEILCHYIKCHDRRDQNIYNLENLIRSDPRWRTVESKVELGQAYIFREKLQLLSFEERAKAMEYSPQVPNLYKNYNDYHKKIVLACFILNEAIFSTPPSLITPPWSTMISWRLPGMMQ